MAYRHAAANSNSAKSVYILRFNCLAAGAIRLDAKLNLSEIARFSAPRHAVEDTGAHARRCYKRLEKKSRKQAIRRDSGVLR